MKQIFRRCIKIEMNKKNKELAKKNVELKEQITRMNVMQTELLKDNIKKEYFGTRAQKEMAEMLEGIIKSIEKALGDFMEFKSKIGENKVKATGEVLKDKSNTQKRGNEGKKVKNFKAMKK